MVHRKRITKKQLKQDKFVQTTFELTDWIRENQRAVTFAALAVLLVVVLGYAYSGYRHKKEEGAETALYRAMQAYRSGNYALAASDLEKLLSEHGGSSIEDEVLYYLANAYYQIEDYDRATVTLDRFKKDFGRGSKVSHEAMITFASVKEQQGNLVEAAQVFIEAASLSRFPYQEKSDRMDAARLFTDAGKYREAIEQYDVLIDDKSSETISPVEIDEVKMLKAQVSALAQRGDTE